MNGVKWVIGLGLFLGLLAVLPLGVAKEEDQASTLAYSIPSVAVVGA